MQIWLCYGTISKMHVERQAPTTLAVIQIPWLREKSKQTKRFHGCANRCKNVDSKVADRSFLVMVISVVAVSGGYGFDEFWNAGVLIMFSFTVFHYCTCVLVSELQSDCAAREGIILSLRLYHTQHDIIS